MSVATTTQHGLYRVLNPVMKAVLRSPLHRMASRTIALLRCSTFCGCLLRAVCSLLSADTRPTPALLSAVAGSNASKQT